MNKPICILLCILLISLSVVPVFATNYIYDADHIINFVSDFNNAISFTNTGTYTVNYFVSSLPSYYGDMYEEIVDYYNVNTSEVIVMLLSENTTSYTLQLWTSTNYPYYSYPDGLTSGTNVRMLISLPQGSVYNQYQVVLNKSTNLFSGYVNNGGNATSITCAQNKSYFRAFYPVHLTISPNSGADYYYFNTYNVVPSPGDGGGSSGDVGNVGDVNWVNFATLFTSYLASNYTFTVNGTTYNPSYSNVGWALAYMFECMENPTLSTITLDNSTMINPVNRLLYGDTTNPTLFDNIKTETVYISSVLDDIEDHGERIGDYLMDLASIYASEQEVEAREAAANNQQAIVDNFLDSEGEGYVSPSDISSVSSMSDGYKTHMSTDAQPSGIWNIFNSNNFGWFSQETVNQLDTTTSNQRGVNTFETPYLDEKIRDIYNSLGVNYDD